MTRPITGTAARALPRNVNRKRAPVAVEKIAQPGCRNAAKRRANTKVAAIQAENPTSPVTKWSSPIVVIVVGGPSGVPGGKPSTGSAVKIAARIIPTPTRPMRIGPHVRPRPVRSARRIPIAAAITRPPQTKKLATWIQPRSPLLRTLAGWRVMSNPGRVNACPR